MRKSSVFTNAKLFAISVLMITCNPSSSKEKINSTNAMLEIRTYNLKPGTRDKFHQLVLTESLPLLKKWKIEVVAYGPSLHDENSYYLIRSFKSMEVRQSTEDAFYSSDDWLKGPREAIMALIENYATIVVLAESLKEWSTIIKASS